MEQYISKSALVAEIERRIKTNKECMLGLRNLDFYQGKVDALNDTLSLLDTLEVKESSLEKDLVAYHNENFSPCNDGTLISCETGSFLTWNDYESIAKHFFELGLKAAQKGK